MTDPRAEIQVKHIPLWSVAVFAMSIAFSIGGLYVTVGNNVDSVNQIKQQIDQNRELQQVASTKANIIGHQVGRIEKSLDKMSDKIDKIVENQ